MKQRDETKHKVVESILHPILRTEKYRVWHVHIGEVTRFWLVAEGKILSNEFIELCQDEIIKDGTSFYKIHLDKFKSFRLDPPKKEENNNGKNQKAISDS